MNAEITIPLYLFILMLLGSLWAAVACIILPLSHWIFRKRVHRDISNINTRLHIGIRRFQLTKKQILVDRLLHSPQASESITTASEKTQTPREIVQKKATKYAQEIVPSFNLYIYYRISYWLAKKFSQHLYMVRGAFVNSEHLSHVDPEATAVFVINHRSNMDYVLVSYLASQHMTLSYAVGEWARIWPLSRLIQAMGAFFVRRNSQNNPLYRNILQQYVQMATEAGVCQAVFPEGMLSRDGKLCSAKLGFLDYMLRNYDHEQHRDIIFIPVGINYDRTIEDRTLLRSLDPAAEQKSKWFVTKTTLSFFLKAWFVNREERATRFGYAGVNFGYPMSMKDYCLKEKIKFSQLARNERFGQVGLLAQKLMKDIASVVPILPVPLVATVFIQNSEEKLPLFRIKIGVHQLIDKLQEKGAPITNSQRPKDKTITRALELLVKRKLIQEQNSIYSIVGKEREVLEYYHNSLAHWWETKGNGK